MATCGGWPNRKDQPRRKPSNKSDGPFSSIPSYQSAAGARIPAEQIIRINAIQHPLLRYAGYSVLTAMSRQVDTVEAIDLARWNVQQKGVDASIVITFDPQLLNPNQVDLDRLRKQIEAVASGPTNAGKILFAPTGGDVSRISNTPAEMAWVEGWSQLVDFGLAAFGTTKSVAGMQSDDSFGSLTARLKQYDILSLGPHLRKIARKMTKNLIRPYFGDLLYMLLKAERIDDKDLLEKQLATNIAAGNVMKVNEFRKLRGLPPVPGPDGEAMIGMGKGQQQPGGIIGDKDAPGGVPNQGGGDRKPMDPERRELERQRPKVPGGEGTLGPRKAFIPMGTERLATILEKAKTNGCAVPIGAYNDGATEYLRKNGVK